MDKGKVMWLANEGQVAYESDEEQWADRQLLVENLGWLLSQTREGIVRAYLDDYEMVHVVYKNGYEELINVNADSYLALIRDVTKNL